MSDAADVDRLAGELKDRYRLVRELGRGGMATVHLAHDLRHERPVALKVVRRELGAVLGRERFLHEIRLTARLQHPRILPLLDSGEAAGLLWYTMPFVDGESLRQRLERERTLPVRDAVAIARQVAEALAHAHAKGIVHRDIKPENILLADGGALVADFGIARAVDAVADERLTGTGLALGTPAYMSPEQAVGGRDVDGRTDTYALGCTLFEMLCGAAPFADGSGPAMLARRLTEPAPSARSRRADTPPAVDAALARALAREPSTRFATAAEFADALDLGATPPTTTVAPVVPRRRGRGALVFAVVLAIAALGTMLAARQRRPPATTTDGDLVAVAPFETLDPSLAIWQDGMVDVLSRYLDGAGPLRSVAPSTVIRQWSGRADRASAGEFGRRIGAGIVVVGSLAPTSRDSVRLRATVVSVRDGRPDDVEVIGATDRIGELSDSLGRDILLAIGRHRPIAAVAGSPLSSTTLPALKAFLRGEQFYRRGNYDSALVHFQHAIDEDSTFALAYQRMVVSLWFAPVTAPRYRNRDYYAVRALRARASLRGRDSLLIVGVGCIGGVVGDTIHDAPSAEAYRCAHQAARAAVERFPSDPESWYMLGEVRFHYGTALDSAGDAFPAFQRTIELDSTFAPAYEHAIGLASGVDPDLAVRYATTAARVVQPGPGRRRFQLDRMLMDPVLAGTPEADSLLASATASDLWGVMEDLRPSVDSGEAAVRVSRSLWSQRHDTTGAVAWVADSLQRRRSYAHTLALRGHLQEAWRLMQRDTPDGFENAYFALAVLRAAPLSDADDAMRRLGLSPPSPIWYRNVYRWSRQLAWWRERRNKAELARIAAFMDRAPRELERRGAQRLARQARSYIALIDGDSASAMEQLASLLDSTCVGGNGCWEAGLTLAQLLVARGRLSEGATMMDRWMPEADGAIVPMYSLERARIAERLGDPEVARRHYGWVVGRWRGADSALQPYVTEARDGLLRLTQESGTSPH